MSDIELDWDEGHYPGGLSIWTAMHNGWLLSLRSSPTQDYPYVIEVSEEDTLLVKRSGTSKTKLGAQIRAQAFLIELEKEGL